MIAILAQRPAGSSAQFAGSPQNATKDQGQTESRRRGSRSRHTPGSRRRAARPCRDRGRSGRAAASCTADRASSSCSSWSRSGLARAGQACPQGWRPGRGAVGPWPSVSERENQTGQSPRGTVFSIPGSSRCRFQQGTLTRIAGEKPPEEGAWARMPHPISIQKRSVIPGAFREGVVPSRTPPWRSMIVREARFSSSQVTSTRVSPSACASGRARPRIAVP